MKKYDLIIIGAGPAGLTAGTYAARYKLDTLIIGKLHGGMAGEAYEICNFPSYEKIKGFELISKMISQVKKLDVEIRQEEVVGILKNTGFEIVTNKGKYSAKKIILATGSEKQKLNIEREKELVGKGIAYCATCDAGFYKGKIVGVVGGGNSALVSALLLAEFAKKVYIIYRKDKFLKAEPFWVEEAKKNKKIEAIFNSNVTKLIGKEKLEEVELNKKKNLRLDGLFVEIGSVPSTELAEQLGLKKENDYIITDKEQRTNAEGVFAAGDTTNNPLKQIVTACGEGAVAAYSAWKDLPKK
ncbi:MAG: FAD-dependent oxidoreductase [archaeon]